MSIKPHCPSGITNRTMTAAGQEKHTSTALLQPRLRKPEPLSGSGFSAYPGEIMYLSFL